MEHGRRNRTITKYRHAILKLQQLHKAYPSDQIYTKLIHKYKERIEEIED